MLKEKSFWDKILQKSEQKKTKENNKVKILKNEKALPGSELYVQFKVAKQLEEHVKDFFNPGILRSRIRSTNLVNSRYLDKIPTKGDLFTSIKETSNGFGLIVVEFPFFDNFEHSITDFLHLYGADFEKEYKFEDATIITDVTFGDEMYFVLVALFFEKVIYKEVAPEEEEHNVKYQGPTPGEQGYVSLGATEEQEKIRKYIKHVVGVAPTVSFKDKEGLGIFVIKPSNLNDISDSTIKDRLNKLNEELDIISDEKVEKPEGVFYSYSEEYKQIDRGGERKVFYVKPVRDYEKVQLKVIEKNISSELRRPVELALQRTFLKYRKSLDNYYTGVASSVEEVNFFEDLGDLNIHSIGSNTILFKVKRASGTEGLFDSILDSIKSNQNNNKFLTYSRDSVPTEKREQQYFTLYVDKTEKVYEHITEYLIWITVKLSGFAVREILNEVQDFFKKNYKVEVSVENLEKHIRYGRLVTVEPKLKHKSGFEVNTADNKDTYKHIYVVDKNKILIGFKSVKSAPLMVFSS